MTEKELSASLEDYLEIICNLLETSECVKAVEIARKLNISRASVSEALSKLAQRNLIMYESHKGIAITSEGLKKAKEIIEKHKTLTDFFEKTLGLNKDEAEENACRVEHVISDNLFKKIKEFQNYCDNNEELTKNFMKGLI
ncbi:MAG: metal-dependent transcriptional regulator [Candidatus Gastranaerophilales bacterium]|nr:metal-dependent transcriptional regulator [Candidatus Gastranaerophilales bacterium]